MPSTHALTPHTLTANFACTTCHHNRRSSLSSSEPSTLVFIVVFGDVRHLQLAMPQASISAPAPAANDATPTLPFRLRSRLSGDSEARRRASGERGLISEDRDHSLLVAVLCRRIGGFAWISEPFTLGLMCSVLWRLSCGDAHLALGLAALGRSFELEALTDSWPAALGPSHCISATPLTPRRGFMT
mmetsp:Transcript_32998/g.77818  ORF Transcript_32998/g.77818 Transcript_32998/m.77818 type:complete len:187 (-) Transcript_32998:1981-2541(-)